ncbi:MAG: hypothetical protein IJS09_05820 [Treponema sp.]|nr:hypothetical protein [Treponema sp.]
MKKLPVIFFIIFVSLCMHPLLAQETVSTPAESEQTEEVSEEESAEEENLPETETLSEEEAQDDKTDLAEGEPKKQTKREKIKALYDDYHTKNSDVKETQRISGLQFLGDFITDKLPLTLDLGAEPNEHGSTIFGILQYDWTNKRASRIRVEYHAAKTSTDANDLFSEQTASEEILVNDWLALEKSKQIEIDVYPYLRYFGDESRLAKTPFLYFGLGAFYIYYWTDIAYIGWMESLKQKLLSNISINGNYHQFGPIGIGSIKVPFLNIFGLTFETTFSPINYVKSTTNTLAKGYHFDIEKNNTETMLESSSASEGQWCSPLLKLDLAIDVFTYFRLRTRFGYRRIYLGGLKEVNFFTFYTDENREEAYKWRYGLEIAFPSSNKTRKKNSHLWAGLYYEHEWTVKTVNDNSSTTHLGKWILCFGT